MPFALMLRIWVHCNICIEKKKTKDLKLCKAKTGLYIVQKLNASPNIAQLELKLQLVQTGQLK